MKTKRSDINDNNRKPSRFLVDNISLLPKGRVLDIAMGKGRNAIYLAEMGFHVDGVDISPGAVEKALARAKASGLEINALVGDLEKDYRIQRDAYDVIICFNYLQNHEGVIEGRKAVAGIVSEKRTTINIS